MGSLIALYDTNILIDFLKHVYAAEQELARNPPNHVSVVTWIEVMAGAPVNRTDETRAFLSTLIIFPLTSEIAERAATLRQQTRLKLPDAIILATAQQEGRTLVTRNTRDFSAAHPAVHIPYTLSQEVRSRLPLSPLQLRPQHVEQPIRLMPQ